MFKTCNGIIKHSCVIFEQFFVSLTEKKLKLYQIYIFILIINKMHIARDITLDTSIST